jgi:uncharacterized membrane protein
MEQLSNPASFGSNSKNGSQSESPTVLEQALKQVGLQAKPPAIKNVNRVYDEKLTLGQRLADTIASTMGSWRFIIIQSCILATWITLNVLGWIDHWDPYPGIHNGRDRKQRFV